MGENERQLLRSARGGNVEAYETLTEAYQKKIFNIILKKCGSETIASELTQEVFVSMFKALKRQQDDGMFVISLYRAAGNICKEGRVRPRLALNSELV